MINKKQDYLDDETAGNKNTCPLKGNAGEQAKFTTRE